MINANIETGGINEAWLSKVECIALIPRDSLLSALLEQEEVERKWDPGNKVALVSIVNYDQYCQADSFVITNS